MNPTIWTAKARATDPKRRAVQAAEREGREGRAEQGQGRAGLRAEAARRGAESERGSASGGGKALPRALPRGGMLSRWGGLGQHRYQIGFSGDVAELSWPNLAYQVGEITCPELAQCVCARRALPDLKAHRLPPLPFPPQADPLNPPPKTDLIF
jgi:hypothetical protein